MMRHTMMPGLWFMTSQEEQDHHNDYIRIDHLATHGLGAIKLIEQQPYGPLTNKETLGQSPFPQPSWSPVSKRNAPILTDYYIGEGAPRYQWTTNAMAALMLGTVAWGLGWRFGLKPAIEHIQKNW